MAYAPIALYADPMEEYAGYWVKGYEQGTTTPLSMATDSTGGTLLAKAEVSSGGDVPIGFIKTTGDAILIPFFNEAYDLWLFPTEAEADANDTTNAIQLADNINSDPSGTLSTDLANTTDVEKGAALVGQAIQNINSKADAKLITPDTDRQQWMDGSYWNAVTGAALSTYADNSVNGFGTIIIDTGGDGSAGHIRSYKRIQAEWFGVSAAASSAFNAAGINEALLIGGVIEISTPGVYLFDTSLTPVSDSTFIIHRGVTLKLDPAVAAGTDMIRLNTLTNVTVTGGGKLDGDRINQANGGHIGVEINGGSNITVDDLEIVDTKDVLVHVKSASLDCSVKRIRGGTIETGQSGIKVDNGCDRATITENNIADIGTDGASQFGDGIYTEASYGTITNNTVRGCNRIGIVKEGLGIDNVITDNVLLDNGDDATNPPAGVWVEGGSGNVVNDNVVNQSGVTVNNFGISLASPETVCEGNRVVGSANTSTSITISNDDITVDSNIVKCIGNSGIKCEGTTLTGVTITNNRVKGSAIGIRATESQIGLTVKGNKVRDFAAGNAVGYEFNTGGKTVVDSIFEGNTSIGPVGAGGTRRGFDLDNFTRVTLASNIARNAYTNGIKLIGTADNILTGNIATGSVTSDVNWNLDGGQAQVINNSSELVDQFIVRAGLTAYAGGGQANAVVLVENYNEVDSVATTGDSVRLRAARPGMKMTVINNGANAMDVYPGIGDNLGAGINTAISLAAGSNVTYFAYDIDNWEAV